MAEKKTAGKAGSTAVDEKPNGAEDVTEPEEVKPLPPNVEVEFRGETFTIPRRRGRWPTEALRAFQRGENIEAIAQLLGELQWRKMLRIAPNGDDIDVFSGVLMKVATEQVLD